MAIFNALASVAVRDLSTQPNGTKTFWESLRIRDPCQSWRNRNSSAAAGIGKYGFIALAVDTEGNMFGLHSLH